MLQDDEYDLVSTPERIQALGFKPQKENLINHILPYAAELDEESSRFLEQVKTNLAKAVMLREMKPACGVWSSRLMKYLRIYGLKFSKEDHLALIKLAYELVIIPDLEPCKIHKYATMFVMLTKKRQLISPEELTLPWRPLYELGKKLFSANALHMGLFHYLTSLESSYLSMVKCARPYFDVSATKEILAELLPQVNPWTSDTFPVSQLVVFLPVSLHPKYAEHGHKLWFDELMTLWDTCYNSQCGVWDFMILFAALAKRNPGAVDWSPHVGKMFTRFLHALNLPVSYKDLQICQLHNLDTKHIASWIVWSICPDGLVLKQLRSFLGGVESYLHSANTGRWSYKLRDLLRKLAREFLNRVRREREKKFSETWENQTPAEYRLTENDISEFVNIVLEPTLQAVYSRSGSLDISIALQNLATLRPAVVVPPLLERLKTSLTSLTEPHRVTAAMSAVAAVARPMLRGPDANYPEGPTHVVPLLLAVLPGLDPNDIKKTLVSLHFILIFSWMVPFIDCSSAHEHWPDLTEEEMLTCESTAQFEDFVLVFFDRLFNIIESSVLEHVRLDTKESDGVRSKTDAVMETALSSAATAVLMQCSPKIFKEALRKFKSFATQTTFETNVSGSMVGVLLRVFARVDSESTLAAFLPNLCEELRDLLASDEALKEENPPRDLMYRLVLLMHVVECDGVVLLKYIPNVVGVLDRALKLHSNYALNRACEILGHTLTSLSCIDLKDWKSSPKDYGAAPEKWLPIREWGHGSLLKSAELKWHVPSEAEAKCAQVLVDRYLRPELTRLRRWLAGERSMCRERRLRCFYIINAALSCGPFLPQPDEVPVQLMESQVPATSIPYTNGVKFRVTLDGENLRQALTSLLLKVQARMLADKTDDTRGLEMLIQVWERVVVTKGSRGGPGLEARLRSYGALERALDGRGGAGARRGGGAGGAAGEEADAAACARLRMLLADAARLQDDSRLDLVCEAGITPSALQALHALADLAVNTYSSVRILSQIRLYWMLSHYPYSYRALVPKLAELLVGGGEGEEWHARHKGALFMMLGPRTGPLVAKQDWEVVRTLWPAVLKAPLSEKPSIVRLEQAFNDCLHRHFPTINTRLVMSDAVVKAASHLLTEDQLNEPEFVQQLSQAVEKEVASSDRTERLYKELIEELVDVVETPNAQWRRVESAMQMLTFCPSLQTAYSARAVGAVARALLHEAAAVRRAAARLLHYALKQRKRKLRKRAVDPYLLARVHKPENHVPGYRKDLEWAMWAEDKAPKNCEEWDRPWLRSSMYGFYAWPEKLVVAAPMSEQVVGKFPPPEQMEEGERYLYEFFNDDANVEKLVGFFTVEEKKGKDKFSGIRFSVFRMLFAHFGPELSDKYLSRALKCAADTQEPQQRFAAEVAAAAIRAPRYWRRPDALHMYSAAMDIIAAGLSSVTPETMEDWGTCVATGVEKLDPLRGGVVLERLMQLCLPPPVQGDADPDQHTSFVMCAKLYVLQGTLGSLKWRGARLASKILKRLDAANFIQHPYQNVRETVGSLLMTIFDTELVFPGGSRGPAPCLAEFIESLQPRFAPLYDENGDIIIKAAVSSCAASPRVSPGGSAGGSGGPAGARGGSALCVAECAVPPPALPPCAAHTPPADDTSQSSEGGESVQGAEASAEGTEGGESAGGARGERVNKQLVQQLDSALRLTGDAAPTSQDHARALNLLTTVLRGCTGTLVRSAGGGGAGGGACAALALGGAACAAARGPHHPHEELPRAAATLLASLAIAHHTAHAFDAALDLLHSLAQRRSWWARLACLEFAQPLLFYGLPWLCEQPARAVRAENFTLRLMRDPRLEVRQSAAKLLTGLMHCRALRDEDSTLRTLMRSCESRELVERHRGVLGLCAYLASRPYSIGPALGRVLAELARHTSAPDPLPTTIRLALADFRRTHHDDWPKHRDALTEEELDLLADLASPPSYCA